MPDPAGTATLLRLMAWLSPAFPVGSYSYSHGLERAVSDGPVEDGNGLRDWIAALLTNGSGWNDAVMLAESWRLAVAGKPVDAAAELAEALAGSAERHLESTAQGAAFAAAAAPWLVRDASALPPGCPYCVAVGAIAGALAVPLDDALAAYLQAFVSNQLQASIRLSVIGQSEAGLLLAGFENDIVATAHRAARSTLDDLGSATLSAEIASMNHETQYSRLFRS